MRDCFPESLGQKRGHAVYTGAHCTQQNTVPPAAQLSIHISLSLLSQQTGHSPAVSYAAGYSHFLLFV